MSDFTTLTFERQMACTPARLYHLLTDRAARERWGTPSEDAIIVIDEFDLRPGGRERARCGPCEAPEFQTVTDFHVVTDACIVGTETLAVGGGIVSVSLVTQDIMPAEGGSRLTVTLQIVSVTGPETLDDYGQGWTGALDNLALMAEDVSA